VNDTSSLPDRIGSYRVERILGAGGMATVYLAEREGPEGFRKRVALKVIRSEFARDMRFRAMLVKEAKIAQVLSHGNIVQVFDFGEADGTYFIAMEYVCGWSLQQLLACVTGRVLPVEIALYVTRCLCRALQHANTRRGRDGQPLGIVHRDVSPHNVLLTEDGQVKLTDFGIAHAVDRLSRSLPGTLKGKTGYLSPEQAAGSGAIDHRSDIFSLGTMTYLMLTGTNPLQGDSLRESLRRALEAKFLPPSSIRPELDPRIDTLVLRAVARVVHDRYESAQQWLEALEAHRLAQRDTTDAAQLADFVRAHVGEPEVTPARSLDQALARAIGDGVTSTLDGAGVRSATTPAFDGHHSVQAKSGAEGAVGAAADGVAAAESSESDPQPHPLGMADTAVVAPPNDGGSAAQAAALTDSAAGAASTRQAMVTAGQAQVAAGRRGRRALGLVAALVLVAVGSAGIYLVAAPDEQRPRGHDGPRDRGSLPVQAARGPLSPETGSSAGEDRSGSAGSDGAGSGAGDSRREGSRGVDARVGRPHAGARAADAAVRYPRQPRRQRPRARGELRVNVVPWARVIVDGRTLGDTPQRVQLAAGRHRLVLFNPKLNLRRALSVTIRPGKSTRIERW
jgi:tRNA A-37 threonylcarbamoyl transferase component Bud32